MSAIAIFQIWRSWAKQSVGHMIVAAKGIQVEYGTEGLRGGGGETD